MYLRGFTGFGASGALTQARSDRFTVSGTFRDMADFCVLVLYDADNQFEHYTVRHLPDFDVTGLHLSFDVTYSGLQPIDSARYSWIDWSQMDLVTVDRATGTDLANPPKIRLWDYASLVNGDYSVAQASCTFRVPGACKVGDSVTLFINNVAFSFKSVGGESADDIAADLAQQINRRDWSDYQDSNAAVIASTSPGGVLTLKNARTGHVAVSGTEVTWLDGIKFPGIAVGSDLYLSGDRYAVASVDSPTRLTLATAPTVSGPSFTYLAGYGGVDGNSITAYVLVDPANQSLSVDQTDLPFRGGKSDGVTWHIDLDFDALGVNSIRQAWFTFAPQLTTGSDYEDTDWFAKFANWSVTGPDSSLLLSCAGPGSVRVGNGNVDSCQYAGSGWQLVPANNYHHGFARRTVNGGDSVTVSYDCPSVHDLYIGTSLQATSGHIEAIVDNASQTSLNANLPISGEVVARRLLYRGVAPGRHSVKLTFADHSNLGTSFLFDFLEAAVPGAPPDAVITYDNVSPALDYDTDATYKVSPQRLLWHLDKLGFRGQLNHYVGVFWWNQRRRTDSIWKSDKVTFSGQWVAGDTPTLAFDGTVSLRKTVTALDTVETIAAHFVHYINSGSIIVRAVKTGVGEVMIYTRTPNWKINSFSVASNSTSGIITVQGYRWNQASNTSELDSEGIRSYGRDGSWQVDPTSAFPLNVGARDWHNDFFAAVKAQALEVTVAFSMELVNPPTDDNTIATAWRARYYDGTPVETDTGFASLKSSQCAPVPNLTAYQSSVYAVIAGMQTAAGLTPWLQFGEFLWWFFSSLSQPVGYCSYTDPISIGLAAPHGMVSGDRVVISGVRGCPAANGTWPITVTDSTHFTIPVPADGAWELGTGIVRGGSMALYDSVTVSRAQSALGRPLYKFTCQDDDPAVNEGADANLLAAQLKEHVDGIRNSVLAQYPNARFEVLFPNDVNNPVCHCGPDVQYPQGGRLNAALNLPAAWKTKETSGLDRFKVEALSWGATYLNLTLAESAITLALTPPFSWPAADVAYLVPWFNGTCPWRHEYFTASTRGLGLINLWAYDHLALMSWPVPFPPPVRKAFRKI